jgi:hypothetical protein
MSQSVTRCHIKVEKMSQNVTKITKYDIIRVRRSPVGHVGQCKVLAKITNLQRDMGLANDKRLYSECQVSSLSFTFWIQSDKYDSP